MITENIHISYCELPAEARALFTIFGLGAAARFSPTPPRKASLTATLSMIWDAERLTPGDLSDPVKMTELVEQTIPRPECSAAWPSVGLRAPPACCLEGFATRSAERASDLLNRILAAHV